ncbi:hypothetical protein TSO5_03210 [Azospirillum sp. TSO5]|nr:hypothetical protein TSO5_03210 [Azospirillum sp. TSO5]
MSYANVLTSAINVDWQELRGDDLEGVQIILPKITRDVLEQYNAEIDEFDEADWLEDNPAEDFATEDERSAAMAKEKQEFDESALDDAIERFKESDAHHEWADTFEPMMNYFWPVELGYGVELEEAATMIDQHAGCATLVYVESLDTHGIALSGGGMDLSWDLAAAYLCCGCVPPLNILSGLPHMKERSNEVIKHIVEVCIPKAAEFMEDRANSLRDHANKLTDLIE